MLKLVQETTNSHSILHTVWSWKAAQFNIMLILECSLKNVTKQKWARPPEGLTHVASAFQFSSHYHYNNVALQCTKRMRKVYTTQQTHLITQRRFVIFEMKEAQFTVLLQRFMHVPRLTVDQWQNGSRHQQLLNVCHDTANKVQYQWPWIKFKSQFSY